LSDPPSRLPAPDQVECCNVCNPRLFRTVPFPWDIEPRLRKPQAGTASGVFYDRLVLWGDNIVNSTHQMVKPEISVRLLTQKGEWISLSTEYSDIHSIADLKEFVRSSWLIEHCDDLFREFSDIKSYVVRNWPGASRPGMTNATQGHTTQKRTGSLEKEYSTPRDVGTSFLQERDEYISSLHQVIARARETSALYSPCPPNRAVPSSETEIPSDNPSPRRLSRESQSPLTTEQHFQQRTSLERRASRQQISQDRRMSVEAEPPKTPEQERAPCMHDEEGYTSALEQIIAQARDGSASCSPSQSTRSMAIVPVDPSFTTTNELMTSTIIVDCSSPVSSVVEDSDNGGRVTDIISPLSKRPASSRGEGVMTKRVALGVLDINARRSPCSQKGKNSHYSQVEYVL
jgi:hypothetical protein